MDSTLYIILPVHNRRALTTRFVEALRAQSDRGFQLLLVDDGSTDGTAEAACALLPSTVVITGTGDWWWAGALQQAWEWLNRTAPADEAMVGICNDDMGIGEDFIARARAELSAHPRTLLLAREVDAATGADIVSGVHADLAHLRFAASADPAAINCLSTRGLFLRWGDFRHIGGFHPRVLPHYLSDYEFTLRAHRLGFKLRVAESVTIRSGGRTTGVVREDLWRAPRGRRAAMIFSPRFKENPQAWSGFVRLAIFGWRCPFLWLKVWLNTVRLLLMSVVRSVRHE